jgi:integrase/recombinase XerD
MLINSEPPTPAAGATIDNVTGVEHIEQFSAYQQFRGFSPKTIKRRRWTLTHLAETIAPRPLLAVDRDDVLIFLASRPAASTRYSLLSDIRQFFRWAIMNDLATVDPTAKIDPPRKPHREPTPLTSEQIHRVIAGTRSRTRLMIMLAAYAGLRVSEIAALHVDDIAHPGRIVVRQGKGGKDRIIPLAPELAEELERWQRRGRVSPDGRLFGKATPDGVSTSIRSVFRRLGIDHRPHDLRAAFATTTAERCNGNLVLVAKLLGHASVTTTQRYVGWNPDGAGIVDALYYITPDDAA